jgi:CDP-diacylglycerol---glycerol-3-phosphate 3-phosphatidyltransferase
VLDQKIRGLWDANMRPVGRALSRTGLNANAVTVAGVVVQAGAAAAILDGRLVLAGLVSIFAGVLDALDGAIAKAQGKATKFGALLDSTTDRLSDALFFLPLAWLYGVAPEGGDGEDPAVAGLALIALVLSFLVSYVKARAEGLGLDCKVGIAERFERLAIIILGLLFDVVLGALIVLVVLSLITFVQRMMHVRKQVSVAPSP